MFFVVQLFHQAFLPFKHQIYFQIENMFCFGSFWKKKLFFIFVCFQIKCQLVNFDPTLSPFFSPSVTATCRDGLMTIKVETDDNFQGVVQSRDYKKPECSSYGENAKVTFLRINLLTQKQDKDYCGVFLSEVRN